MQLITCTLFIVHRLSRTRKNSELLFFGLRTTVRCTVFIENYAATLCLKFRTVWLEESNKSESIKVSNNPAEAVVLSLESLSITSLSFRVHDKARIIQSLLNKDDIIASVRSQTSTKLQHKRIIALLESRNSLSLLVCSHLRVELKTV